MSDQKFNLSSRRAFLAGSAAMLASPALAQSNVNGAETTETERDITETVRRNISSFRTLDWRPYFSDTNKGAVLVDIDSRAVHFWSEDQTVYKLYP
jgi:L,D-transpeptidase ErfK/SrfK